MTGRRSPSEHTTAPTTLALIAEGVCPCHGDNVPVCGQPIDPESLVWMCTGHDHTLQVVWPDRYREMAGQAPRVLAPVASPEEAAMVAAHLTARQEQDR